MAANPPLERASPAHTPHPIGRLCVSGTRRPALPADAWGALNSHPVHLLAAACAACFLRFWPFAPERTSCGAAAWDLRRAFCLGFGWDFIVGGLSPCNPRATPKPAFPPP